MENLLHGTLTVRLSVLQIHEAATKCNNNFK